MSFLLITAGSVFFFGLVQMVHGLMHAPLGEETEAGFQVVCGNDKPNALDISCVWKVGTQQGSH